MELFDVVNEYGEPTGEIVDRETAHLEGIRHRTSHLWLLRKRGTGTEILLQKRAMTKSFPGCFDISSAGHIPAGDDFRESAIRELREELGVTAAESDLIFCGDKYIEWDDEFFGKPYHDRQYTRVFMLWVDLDEDEFILQEEEVDDVLWMDLEECIKGVKRNTFSNCIDIDELMIVRRTTMCDRNCTVLVSGFEPFGEDVINPSWEAVSRIPDQINGAEVIKERLPVVFKEAGAKLQDMISRYSPDIVICVGLAGGRSGITPELAAVNLANARIPDNKGNQPAEEKIIINGEERLLSTLPIQAMVERLHDAGLPAEISESAGTFVCNEVFYSLMQMTQCSDIKAGFIHVPFTKGMRDDQPAMELSDITSGLLICIEEAVKLLI